MLAFPSQVRFFLYSRPTDMRKGFDGLAGLVVNQMGADPVSGDTFIFLNRYRTHVKLLFWDGDGFALFYKRLARGVFPVHFADVASRELSRQDLMLLLEGLEILISRKTPRYSRPQHIITRNAPHVAST
jgi:transposase